MRDEDSREYANDMPDFIVHGVADDERFVGPDGVQRPYGMSFQDNDGGVFGARNRKAQPESGSFGKSTRRSRSKSRTGTPGPKKQEDPTLAAAEVVFTNFFADQAKRRASPSRLSNSVSQPTISPIAASNPPDNNGEPSRRYVHKEPTEVILRGFKQDQQYGALNQYEKIAGMICEDYARDPPIEQRKFKGNVRDAAVMRKRPLTVDEKAKALRFAGGDHWIKVTFESAEAAEHAVECSPQNIMGYLVYAELYRGVPPTDIGPVPATNSSSREPQRTPRRSQGSVPRLSQATPAFGRGQASVSPPVSNSSSQTLDTATVSRSSSATVANPPAADGTLYCRHIPTARKIVLKPAELALLPQQSFNQRVLARIPVLGWLTTDVIGSQVPIDINGDFDYANASFYWRIIYWLDCITGWFDLKSDRTEERNQ